MNSIHPIRMSRWTGMSPQQLTRAVRWRGFPAPVRGQWRIQDQDAVLSWLRRFRPENELKLPPHMDPTYRGIGDGEITLIGRYDEGNGPLVLNLLPGEHRPPVALGITHDTDRPYSPSIQLPAHLADTALYVISRENPRRCSLHWASSWPFATEFDTAEVAAAFGARFPTTVLTAQDPTGTLSAQAPTMSDSSTWSREAMRQTGRLDPGYLAPYLDRLHRDLDQAQGQERKLILGALAPYLDAAGSGPMEVPERVAAHIASVWEAPGAAPELLTEASAAPDPMDTTMSLWAWSMPRPTLEAVCVAVYGRCGDFFEVQRTVPEAVTMASYARPGSVFGASLWQLAVARAHGLRVDEAAWPTDVLPLTLTSPSGDALEAVRFHGRTLVATPVSMTVPQAPLVAVQMGDGRTLPGIAVFGDGTHWPLPVRLDGTRRGAGFARSQIVEALVGLDRTAPGERFVPAALEPGQAPASGVWQSWSGRIGVEQIRQGLGLDGL